jgi:dihydroorotase
LGAKILIKNGRIIDPANKLDEISDILIADGKISKIAKNIPVNNSKVIEAKDKIVMPGIIDMHVHLREPGREDKETVASGTRAALKGGVTSLACMPNTQPAMDSAENVRLLKSIIKKTALVNVFIVAAITEGQRGERLTDIAALKKEGIVAISDDGASVDNANLFLEGLKKAKQEKILVICHSEDKELSSKGVVNLGLTSTRLGLRGISKESEYKRVARDIELAEKADTHIHITHLSCLESVELIAKAKKKGIKITCDTAPHYFALSEEAVLDYDTNKKMNPPLRSEDDLAAIKEGLKNNIIDAIASDHAPHTENEKDIEFERSEFGVIGLETELAVAVTELVSPGLLDLSDLAQKMCLAPAQILGIPKGNLSLGACADMIILNMDKKWVVDKRKLISKSKNSAFLGKELKGAIEYTILKGEVVYQA